MIVNKYFILPWWNRALLSFYVPLPSLPIGHLTCSSPITVVRPILWMWGNDWVCNLDWDPKEWTWRRLGILPETTILNYTTKRGYRTTLRQDNTTMSVDAEMEAEGYDNKTRARFINRIWHPYLPRKVSAMQWLVLTEGLPSGLGGNASAYLATIIYVHIQPTKHFNMLSWIAYKSGKHLAWELFRNTRRAAELPPIYHSWKHITRGLTTQPPGPTMDEDLWWDTSATFSINTNTPWDILRANLLWSIWCQCVAHAFKDDIFYLGVVLWHAWRNTIYYAMEAYKELFRHKRNEEKRQEMISCFQKMWTSANIFGKLQGQNIKWNLTPHLEFLPMELGAWTTPPIQIHCLSPSPDIEA